MTIFKRIASWLDREKDEALVKLNQLTGAQDRAVKDGMLALETRDREIAKLKVHLDNSAISIAGLMAERSVARAALLLARMYVQDTIDDETSALTALSATSKKRPAQAAVIEAVKADLDKINAAITPEAN